MEKYKIHGMRWDMVEGKIICLCPHKHIGRHFGSAVSRLTGRYEQYCGLGKKNNKINENATFSETFRCKTYPEVFTAKYVQTRKPYQSPGAV